MEGVERGRLDQSKEVGPNEEELKLINHFFEFTKNWLRDDWGIDNLTTIEAAHLRRIVKEVLEQDQWQKQLLKNKEVTAKVFFASIQDEATARWFFELYEIKLEDLQQQRTPVIEDLTTGKIYKYTRTKSEIDEESDKYVELKNLGHKLMLNTIVPNSLKEYIKILREKAHTP
jgi:hypothetical protein